MRNVLKHRGPDDDGEYIDNQAGLSFRRLAIIDLSPAGHQPLSNEDGALWLIFNGEIYNFRELRKPLEERGHRFRSSTDSEVIVHAYEEHGIACLEKLRGMFAFALWDKKKQTLLLARDRFGKKPLFYTVRHNTIYFASELQALLEVLPSPEVNATALTYYLRFQFIPSPFTIYQGIHKLPPGNRLLWKNGTLSIEPYWYLDFSRHSGLTIDEAGREFERRFREAVRLRLVSDVPLGVFLSGGLDSTIVTALMAELVSEPVKTFSIGFMEESHNELPLARLVAERFRTNHHEFVMQPDVVAVLPKLLRHYGEPFADSSAIATYYVAKETRKYVTVALTGDGGDENFAGYEKFSLLSLLQPLMWIPQSLRQLAGKVMKNVGMVLPSAFGRKVTVGSQLLGGSLVSQYIDLFSVFSDPELQQVLIPKYYPERSKSAESLAAARISDLQNDTSFIRQVSALDLRLYLPEGLMTKTDIATMANSLEARSPFLDQEVIDFTATLPDDYKIRDGMRKYLLRRQFGHLLPPELLHQRKRGFDLPVNAWIRGTLKPFVVETLSSQSFRSMPYFNFASIDRLLAEHFSNHAHHGIKIWALLCLALWQKEFQR